MEPAKYDEPELGPRRSELFLEYQLSLEDIIMPNRPSQKLVHSIRDGAIEVALWPNEGDKGAFYCVTSPRSYKQDDERKDGDSYSQNESVAPAKLLDRAHTWILSQQQQRSQQAAD
jgi:hypothetical protein